MASEWSVLFAFGSIALLLILANSDERATHLEYCEEANLRLAWDESASFRLHGGIFPTRRGRDENDDDESDDGNDGVS